MDDRPFRLEIEHGAKADVYLATPGDVPWDLVASLDAAGLRVVGDLPGLPRAEDRVRRIMSGCAAFLVVADAASSADVESAARIAAELGVAQHRLRAGETLPELHRAAPRAPPYAFLVGRLERDFTLARAAIRAAVEHEAGIPCLWADDGCHRTNVASVREATRLLIEHATFVIADLTLGVENPRQENPSRAHEIGMAIAYRRPLMLSSQEPRRYPYFSIGDLQMTFWETEDELERQTRNWVRAHAGSIARRVFNHELPSPQLAPAAFAYDGTRRYIGPNTPRASPDGWGSRAVRTGAVAVSAAILSVLAWVRR
jgi:hypothetical protein